MHAMSGRVAPDNGSITAAMRDGKPPSKMPQRITDSDVQLRENGSLVWNGGDLSSFIKSKYPDTAGITLGTLDLLDTGLEGLLGIQLWGDSPRAAMHNEHCHEADFSVPFKAHDKAPLTTPEAEWKAILAGTLPTYTDGGEYGHSMATKRFAMPLAVLEQKMHEKNAELVAIGFPNMQLTLDECLAARMYTGPCFAKYTLSLRRHARDVEGRADAFTTAKFIAMNCGNQYAMTIYAFNSYLMKVAKLMPVTRAFRSMRGDLPPTFFTPNTRGLKGGVELGFSSFTTDRSVAVEYGGSRRFVLLEVQMGIGARPGDTSWLSQFPHESEAVYPPVMGLDVLGARIEEEQGHGDGRLVIECGLAMPAWLTLQQAFDKTPRFLDRFEIDKGAPLHISATAAVLAATEMYGDGTRRVALKFMCRAAQVEAELSGRLDLDPAFVVAVLRVLTDEADPQLALGSGGVPIERHSGLADTLRKQIASRRPPGEGGSAAEQPDYRYCLVLDYADCNLGHALTHERFSGDWPLVRKIGLDLIHAVAHLHDQQRIHADLKPLNIVRVGLTWQLIDFDVSSKISASFGDKVPSSGYCPPEMAIVLRAAMDATGAVDTGRLSEYTASVAYDLWSFGVVLFHMGFGKSLWHTNQDDSISPADLRRLAEWGEATLNAFVYREAHAINSPEAKALIDLIRKLLTPSVGGRLAHFVDGAAMRSVADHAFFACKSLDAVVLERIALQVDNTYELQQQMDQKLDRIIEGLNAQFGMLSTLLHGVDKLAPKLICFLPAAAVSDAAPATGSKVRKWTSRLTKPADWFNQRVCVFFFDPVRLSLAPTNGGKGFELTFPKAWVAKAMPYVKLGLTALKVAAAAGRLSGLPIPDVVGFLDSQLGAIEDLKFDAIVELSSVTNDPREAAHLLGAVDSKCKEMVSGVAQQAAPTGGDPFAAKLHAPLEKSAQELDALLPQGWREKCGLEMTVALDGTVEWVLPHDVAEFKGKGKELLGKRSEAVVALPMDSSLPLDDSAADGSGVDDDHGGETQPLLSLPSKTRDETTPASVAQLARQVQMLQDVVMQQQQQQQSLCCKGCVLA